MSSSRILIATPAYNGVTTTGYVQSIVETVSVCHALDIGYEYMSFSVSQVEAARNYLASIMLVRNFTHLLFIDADMKFRASLIEKMLTFEGNFISSMYVKRAMQIERILHDYSEHRHDDIAKIISRNMDYTGTFPRQDDTYTIQLHNGFANVIRTGMGICLIHRDVFVTMLQRGIANPIADSADIFRTEVPIYDFFDRVMQDGHLLSEDYSFCKKWVDDCSGEIWANVDEFIQHIGTYEFGGICIDKLKYQAVRRGPA